MDEHLEWAKSNPLAVAIVASLVVVVVATFAVVTAVFRPVNIAVWNELDYQAQKADDMTSYETRKKVEESARAYITNYEMYKANYEAYKDSEREGDQIYARDQRTMANRTAIAYNEYFQKNSFIIKSHIQGLPERLEPI